MNDGISLVASRCVMVPKLPLDFNDYLSIIRNKLQYNIDIQ